MAKRKEREELNERLKPLLPRLVEEMKEFNKDPKKYMRKLRPPRKSKGVRKHIRRQKAEKRKQAIEQLVANRNAKNHFAHLKKVH